MPDKRYRQSPGSVGPNMGGGTPFPKFIPSRSSRGGGGSNGAKDAIAAQGLDLREREFAFAQKKFVAELAENERQRQHALELAQQNFANDAQLKAIQHDYNLKEAQIKQEYAVELENIQTGNKSALQNEKAELDSGFTPGGFAKSRALKDTALGQPGIEGLYANDLRSQLMKSSFDNDKVSSEAERNRVMSIAPGHVLTSINNVPDREGALFNAESVYNANTEETTPGGLRMTDLYGNTAEKPEPNPKQQIVLPRPQAKPFDVFRRGITDIDPELLYLLSQQQ